MKQGSVVSENLSYKVVALFIALILWLTILGRRDFEAIKTLPVVIKTSAGLQLKDEPKRSIEVKIVGNRRGIKEFEEAIKKKPLEFEVTRTGFSRLPIRRSDITISSELRLMWIRPEFIEVTARRVKSKTQEQNPSPLNSKGE